MLGGIFSREQGKKVLVVTLIAESLAQMLNHFSNFRFFDASLVGDEIVFLAAIPALPETGCLVCLNRSRPC